MQLCIRLHQVAKITPDSLGLRTKCSVHWDYIKLDKMYTSKQMKIEKTVVFTGKHCPETSEQWTMPVEATLRLAALCSFTAIYKYKYKYKYKAYNHDSVKATYTSHRINYNKAVPLFFFFFFVFLFFGGGWIGKGMLFLILLNLV